MNRQTRALDGIVALVTGASRGIGACIARDLAIQGAHVIVNYRNRHDLAQQVLAEIQTAGGQGEVQCADVSDSQVCRAMFSDLTSRGMAPAVLVNNAGITRDRSLKKMTIDEFTDVIDTNLLGAVHCTRLALPSMMERKFGRIVNVASVIGQIGAFGQTNYAAAKGGLIGFTRALALEVAKYGITANAVSPGYVNTAMWLAIPEKVQQEIVASIPLQRIAEPEEIAECVRYLVVEAGYVTGQTINVNGGLYRG